MSATLVRVSYSCSCQLLLFVLATLARVSYFFSAVSVALVLSCQLVVSGFRFTRYHTNPNKKYNTSEMQRKFRLIHSFFCIPTCILYIEEWTSQINSKLSIYLHVEHIISVLLSSCLLSFSSVEVFFGSVYIRFVTSASKEICVLCFHVFKP